MDSQSCLPTHPRADLLSLPLHTSHLLCYLDSQCKREGPPGMVQLQGCADKCLHACLPVASNPRIAMEMTNVSRVKNQLPVPTLSCFIKQGQGKSRAKIRWIQLLFMFYMLESDKGGRAPHTWCLDEWCPHGSAQTAHNQAIQSRPQQHWSDSPSVRLNCPRIMHDPCFAVHSKQTKAHTAP